MYRRNVRKDGTCGIYLQVIIHRKKLEIGLDLQWPPDRFDENGGCKPVSKDDVQRAHDYNIIINNARKKANEIMMYYRMRDLPIDIDMFRREYYSNMNKNNFIEYFDTKSLHRWNKGLISAVTYKQEKSTLAKLKQFKDVIPFNSFHAQWGQEFDRYLENEFKNDQNTRWSEKKRIRTYLNMAASEGIAFIDPYKSFRIGQKKSRFKALSQTQFEKLWNYYLSSEITPPAKSILRRFLFSCNTGLRISDLMRLTRDNFKNGRMTIAPHKTKRFGTKVDDAPLNDLALALLNEEIRANDDHRLFQTYTEQYGNRTLKNIAKAISMDHQLSNHIGRSTFASLYDQSGGNHRSLMEYMGLTKMETLMKYVQTNKEVIQEGINKMNKTLAPKPEVKKKKRSSKKVV